MNTLLALCARGSGHVAQYQRLARQAHQYQTWHTLPTEAERHGLGPLCYKHLVAAAAPLTSEIRRELQGLYLRHRQSNRIRTRVLAEMLTAYQTADIPVLLLKGAALAHTVYPEPGLRPMRDMDILVREQDAYRAQQILTDMRFTSTPLPPEGEHIGHHLPPAKQTIDGLLVTIEVHRQLFPATRHFKAIDFDTLWSSAYAFDLKGIPAYTLGHKDMLGHLYKHTFGPDWISKPIRLIGLADIVSLVEKFADEIDWPRLERKYPQVVNALPLLHFVTPWSEKLLEKQHFDVADRPKGVGKEFEGWPHASLAAQRDKGIFGILKDTFVPSEWWLRLYYGMGDGKLARLWCRWARHPAHILGWVFQYLSECFTNSR